MMKLTWCSGTEESDCDIVSVSVQRVMLVSVNSDQISKEKVLYCLEVHREQEVCAQELKLAQTCLEASFITTCQEVLACVCGVTPYNQ